MADTRSAGATLHARQLRTRARFGAHVLWDGLTNPSTSQPKEIPWRPEAISPAWMTAVLASATAGAVALNVDVSGGDEGSSVRRRVRVQWNEAGRAAGLPHALFAKSTPTLAMRLSAGMVVPNEGRFLREFRPAIAIEAPHCVYSGRDERSGRSILLLQDLVADRSARFCNVNSAIDAAQADQIVDLLATLHGTFLARRPVEDCAWLATFEDFFRGAVRTGIAPAHEEAMHRAVSVIPPALYRQREKIWPCVLQAVEAHGKSPRTVIHSDVHLGNWYVTGDGHMGICDWARVCRSLWTRDLAYALMTTLDVTSRRAWERPLIEHYLDRLRADFGVAVPFDQAWLAYRQQSFAALLMWTPTLCPPKMLPAMQPEGMTLEMIHRIATAIDDIDALNAFS
jgi:Phosphotransferase enzyme family